MSGLGIKFSPSVSPASEAWEENGIPSLHIVSKRKMSRWSESTHESKSITGRAGDAAPNRHRNSDSLSSFSYNARLGKQLELMPALEQDPEDSQTGPHLVRNGRSSVDSEASCSPLTPRNDLEQIEIMPNTLKTASKSPLSAPRRAPQPPTSEPASPIPEPMPRPLPDERRLSIPQSMMRTLGGRKKDVIIPLPLVLSPVLPSLPANIEMAPMIYHVVIPPGSRKNSKTKVSISPNSSKPSSRRTSEQSRRGSSNKTPRLGSFSSVFRSLQRSFSGETRNGSNGSISSLPPTTPALITSKAKAKLSPALSSPLLQEIKFVPENTSESSKVSSSTASTPFLGPSPRLIQPTTTFSNPAKYNQQILGISIHSPALSVQSSTANDSTSPEFLQASASAIVEIKYADPWGPTYAPDSTFNSPISVSPGQHAPTNCENKRASHSDASLYKQSILEKHQGMVLSNYVVDVSPVGSCESNQVPREAVPSPNYTPSVTSFVRVQGPITTPSAPFATPAPRFLTPSHKHESFRSAASSVEPWSPLLSPSQPAPLTPQISHSRRGSRKSLNSIDRVAEQESAPHLYLETLGAMSLRNPWAAASNAGSTMSTKVVPKRSKTASVRPNDDLRGSGQTRDGEKMHSDGIIEFAFLRKRSELNVLPTKVELGASSTTSGNISSKAARLPDTNLSPVELVETGHSSFLDCTTSPSIASESSPVPLQVTVSNFMETPVPALRNPYLVARIPVPGSQFESAIPIRSRNPSPARKASFLDEQPGMYEHGRFTRRMPSTSDISLRRPSMASIGSSGSFPGRPTRLETRRQTELSGKGIRVSLDTNVDEDLF